MNFWAWMIPCSVDTHGMEGQDPATALKTWVPLLQTQLCYALAEALKVSKVTLIPVLFIWHWLFGKLVISERKRKKLRWNWSNFFPVWTGFLKLPCKLSLVNPSPGVKTSRQRWCWGFRAKSRTPKGSSRARSSASCTFVWMLTQRCLILNMLPLLEESNGRSLCYILNPYKHIQFPTLFQFPVPSSKKCHFWAIFIVSSVCHNSSIFSNCHNASNMDERKIGWRLVGLENPGSRNSIQ